VNIILFGPPGAGKGTQAKNLEKKFNNFQISTGDLLRNEIEKNSDIGKKIINNMNEGKFVDDKIVNKLMEKIILDPQKKNKFIFDGYPRTLEQAKNLDLLLDNSKQKIDFIFFLNVDKNTIINRVKNRKILENTKVKKSLIAMSKYKNFLLLIINNNNISKGNSINTLRYYGIGAQIIKDLNVKKMVLISRSKKKIIGLDGFGLKIKKQIIIK